MGLRESKKLQTRRQIANEAFGLFATRGFDRVTVAEIAAATGVSDKTVFNYFPTKEDIFFDEVEEREAALVSSVRNRRPDESVVAGLRRMQIAHCRDMSRPGFEIFARIIEESPALRAKELEVMARFTDALAGALAGEPGVGELDARLAATLIVGLHWQFFRVARSRALAGRHGPAAARGLQRDVGRAYELLEHGLGSLGTH